MPSSCFRKPTLLASCVMNCKCRPISRLACRRVLCGRVLYNSSFVCSLSLATVLAQRCQLTGKSRHLNVGTAKCIPARGGDMVEGVISPCTLYRNRTFRISYLYQPFGSDKCLRPLSIT